MNTLKQKRELSRTAKQRIFFWCIITLPLLQFCIFYIGVNLNSFLLAFRNYDYETGYSFAGFNNFKRVWYDWINNEIFGVMFANSFLTYVVTLFVGLTLALLFSYFIYKKMPLSNMFRVMLFMPNILSTLVMALLFKYFSENAIPELFGNSIGGLLSTTKTAMPTLLFFLVWTGVRHAGAYVCRCNEQYFGIGGGIGKTRRNFAVQGISFYNRSFDLADGCNVYHRRHFGTLYQPAESLQLLRKGDSVWGADGGILPV